MVFISYIVYNLVSLMIYTSSEVALKSEVRAVDGIQRFSELFHGSARAIIRSLESGLARAIASESDRSPQT